VLADSAASEAGVRAGNVIDAVRGRPVSALTVGGILDLLEPPVRRALTLRRNGETVGVTLTRVLAP